MIISYTTHDISTGAVVASSETVIVKFDVFCPVGTTFLNFSLRKTSFQGVILMCKLIVPELGVFLLGVFDLCCFDSLD